MKMQTLTFNTKTKTVVLVDSDGNVLFTSDNVPTVSVKEVGFYEVMVRISEMKAVPVLRVPIANTNMFIDNDMED